MAARFRGPSSFDRLQSFTAPAPVTGTPFSFGAWVRPHATAAFQAIISFSASSSTTDYFSLQALDTDVWSFTTYDGTQEDVSAGTVTLDEWHFVLGRSASSSSRHLSVIGSDGIPAHASSAATLAPSNIDNVCIGAIALATPVNYMTGDLAELWYTKSDVYAGGGAMDDDFLRQLAYGGPFSIPFVANELVEYHSFAGAEPAPLHHNGFYQFGVRGQREWTNINMSARGCPHVPLPPSYVSLAEARGLALF